MGKRNMPVGLEQEIAIRLSIPVLSFDSQQGRARSASVWDLYSNFIYSILNLVARPHMKIILTIEQYVYNGNICGAPGVPYTS